MFVCDVSIQDVRRAAEVIKYNHAFRKYIATIVSKCPEDFQRSLRRNDDYVDYNEQETSLPTEKALIKMHINVINVSSNPNLVRYCVLSLQLLSILILTLLFYLN